MRWSGWPVAAAFFVLLALLTEFFSMWGLVPVERVSFVGLVFHLLPTFFIFLAASAALPDEVGDRGHLRSRCLLLFPAALFLSDAEPSPSWAMRRARWRACRSICGADLGDRRPLERWSRLIFVIFAFSRRRWLHWLGLGMAFALILVAPARDGDRGAGRNRSGRGPERLYSPSPCRATLNERVKVSHGPSGRGRPSRPKRYWFEVADLAAQLPHSEESKCPPHCASAHSRRAHPRQCC